TARGSRRGRTVAAGRRDRLEDVRLELVLGAGHAVPFDRFDLSAVGVYLYSDFLLSEGEEVSLSIRLPFSPRAVEIAGRVVRAQVGDEQQSAGMGVVFRDLDAGMRQELREFIARRFIRRAT
ncbi:MAG TPA: PilZ domain-containing protein, partial [Polyangia bacterium]|nr:PilZ domain-containing protein [Polyangia bacterium]